MKIYKIKDRDFIYVRSFKICADPVCVDIETSNNHAEDPKELITWVSSIQVQWGDEYHLFRRPEELVEWMESVTQKYRLILKGNDKILPRVVLYIHNLSYDISYLLPYFREYLKPHNEYEKEFYEFNGLIDGPNSYITYVQGPFEFRCSYRLSNRSLDKWSKDMNTEHRKQIGLYDYDKVIYQDTELNEKEQTYDRLDVVVLQEALKKQMEFHHDNLATIPLTSTGYPRRDLRASCLGEFKTNIFGPSRLDYGVYTACLKAYAGGYTHANRFLKDKILKGDIRHRDFKSFYPSVIRTKTYPLGRWLQIYDQGASPTYYDIKRILALSPEFSTMTNIRIFKASLKSEKITMPFMQEAKLHGKKGSILSDNGRVIYFDNPEGLEASFDNCTLKIINEQYNLDYEILKVWKNKNRVIPHQFTDIVDKYFKGKSDLKNVAKELEVQYGETDPRTLEAKVSLQVVKALLNAIYGVTATNPIRSDWELTDENETRLLQLALFGKYEEVVTDKLDSYYDAKTTFLPYQIGVWITAYAREELYEYIQAIGYESIIYCDTDSAFYLSSPEIEERIESLNQEKRKTAPFVVLDNGKKEYYDAFEEEPPIKEFKALHSKCYGYINNKGELVSVIAGVPARTLTGMKDGKPIYTTREQELGSLENLKDEFPFKVNTGVTAVYVGATGKGSERKPKLIEIDGHLISTAGGCVIRPLKEKVIHETPYNFQEEKALLSESLPNSELYTELF